MSEFDNVAGRFQHAVSKSGINTIVDYAHTPDALKNVLETINAIRTINEQLLPLLVVEETEIKRKAAENGKYCFKLKQSSGVYF